MPGCFWTETTFARPDDVLTLMLVLVPKTGTSSARDLPGAERRRVRQLLTDVADGESAAAQSAAARLAVLALVLCGAEARIWDDPQGSDGWMAVCAAAVRNLTSGDLPARLTTAAASWTAIAVYLMHEQRPAGGRRQLSIP